jgi:hypothetical protein
MNISKYIIFFIVLIVLSSIYKKLKLNEDKNTSDYYYNMVDKYLLNKNSLGMNNNKPFIWIHLHSDNTIIPEVNSRYWNSFGSRATKDLNQPYQYLTIQSIINKCGDDFNICLIDDQSFQKIIPDWTINLNIVANPVRTHIRLLALCSILNIYGGLLVPSSFICFKSLKDIYNTMSDNNKMFVGEFMNRAANPIFNNAALIPSSLLMGCTADNLEMKEFIKYLEILNSKDFTAEQDFLGKSNQWLLEAVRANKINIITGQYLGTKKECNNPVHVEELTGSSFIKLSPNALGLYIPWNELINRVSLQWFARLSPQQVLESDTVIGKYLLINN